MNDDELLDRFREWLHETRCEAAGIEEHGESLAPTPQRFGLHRLVEEFTALRHELKLQTRSSRALEERLEASLSLLADAAALFRSAAAEEGSAASETAGKNFASALAELDEALERFRQQLNKVGDRPIYPSSPTLMSELNELWYRQPWWRRTLLVVYHSSVCEKVKQAEERAGSEPQGLLAALRDGYLLIQQRLSRTMANAGVARIHTLGRLVDPEQMVVLEVVEGDGRPGEVIDEIRRGYTWKGGLLRAAEVRAVRPRFETGAPGNQPSENGDGPGSEGD